MCWILGKSSLSAHMKTQVALSYFHKKTASFLLPSVTGNCVVIDAQLMIKCQLHNMWCCFQTQSSAGTEFVNSVPKLTLECIMQVSRTAKMMITQGGFSKKLGQVAWTGGQQQTFIGQQAGQPADCSGQTNDEIENEIKSLVDRAYRYVIASPIQSCKPFNAWARVWTIIQLQVLALKWASSPCECAILMLLMLPWLSVGCLLHTMVLFQGLWRMLPADRPASHVQTVSWALWSRNAYELTLIATSYASVLTCPTGS